jgi:hypothetical protein
MARLTHPDFHPRDPFGAMRFRAVREAYEAIQRQGPHRTGRADALQITFSPPSPW